MIPLPFAVPSSGSPALAVDALRNFDDAFAPLHPRQSHFEKHTMIARFYFGQSSSALSSAFGCLFRASIVCSPLFASPSVCFVVQTLLTFPVPRRVTAPSLSNTRSAVKCSSVPAKVSPRI